MRGSTVHQMEKKIASAFPFTLS